MLSASIARPRTVAVRASKEAGASAKAVAPAPKASVVDRRAALGLIAGVAAVVAAPSESKAAYGEAANVFGKVRESWAVCSCPIGRFSREESRGRRGERERDDGEKGKSKPRESSIEDEIAKRSTDDGLIAFFLPPALFVDNTVSVLVQDFVVNAEYFDGAHLNGPVPAFFSMEPAGARAAFNADPHAAHALIAPLHKRFLLMEQLTINAATRYLTSKFRSARGVPAAKRPRPPPADKSDDVEADTGQFFLSHLSGIFTNLIFYVSVPSGGPSQYTHC